MNAPDQAYKARIDATNRRLMAAARDAMGICGEFGGDNLGIEDGEIRVTVSRRRPPAISRARYYRGGLILFGIAAAGALLLILFGYWLARL